MIWDPLKKSVTGCKYLISVQRSGSIQTQLLAINNLLIVGKTSFLPKMSENERNIYEMDLGSKKMSSDYWKMPTEYRSFYHMRIVGHIDLVFCVITLISNAFIIAIFKMKSNITPGNTIFTHMAIMESLTTIISLVRVWHEYFRVTECAIALHRTYIWEMVSLYTYKIAFMFRHIAVWLAVMMTVWRYIAVVHPLRERDWCNMQITRKLIIAGYIFGLVLSVPPFFAWGFGPAEKLLDEKGCIMRNYVNGTNTTTIYEFKIPVEDNPVIVITSTAFYSGIKILPSIAFAVMSYKVILALTEAKKRRKNLLVSRNGTINSNEDQHTTRTTKILMIILGLFVTAEVPHGVHLVLFALYGPKFFWDYYYYAQEVMNLFIQISESFNFVIYYAMSQQFRKNFRQLFDKNNSQLVSTHTASISKNISSSSSAHNLLSSTVAIGQRLKMNHSEGA
ncbi:sex peptide receptor-like [Planococcus citri]|uniref:sex peptide receptor-like n=1 Tax=Planococcus citri TaxID=170843 RepID=UPI0031F93807